MHKGITLHREKESTCHKAKKKKKISNPLGICKVNLANFDLVQFCLLFFFFWLLQKGFTLI